VHVLVDEIIIYVVEIVIFHALHIVTTGALEPVRFVIVLPIVVYDFVRAVIYNVTAFALFPVEVIVVLVSVGVRISIYLLKAFGTSSVVLIFALTLPIAIGVFSLIVFGTARGTDFIVLAIVIRVPAVHVLFMKAFFGFISAGITRYPVLLGTPMICSTIALVLIYFLTAFTFVPMVSSVVAVAFGVRMRLGFKFFTAFALLPVHVLVGVILEFVFEVVFYVLGFIVTVRALFPVIFSIHYP
jgi:hypothetical protein